MHFYNTYKIEPYIKATGRSEMNGIVGRLHSTLLELYRIQKTENPEKSVIDLVDISIHKYNSTIHSCTKFTPYEIILPSNRSQTIVETVFENLTTKQKKDLTLHNKNKKNVAIDNNIDAFETN